MRHRRSTGQGQPRHHRKNGRERYRRDEAEENAATHRVGQVDRRHVVAAEQSARRILERRVGADQQDRAETDDEGQDVEVTNETSGVQHALTRFLGIAHREEAHQDVRQAGRTEHQRQTQENAEIGSFTRPPGLMIASPLG